MEMPKDHTHEISPDIIKPFAGNGHGYPYASLANNRRLEELAYTLYKKEAELGNLQGIDAVSLMSGSSDLGQDCRLIGAGKSLGNIQCKLLSKPLSVDDFGKEIVKFILYSIIDTSLIANPSDFTYYIIAPKGFSRNSDTLITGWNLKIATAAGLDKWVRANLKNSSFNSLDFDSVSAEVRRVLSLIRVEPVQAADLDILLNQTYNCSVPEQFFQIRTLISVEQFKALSAKVAGRLESSQIASELERGSLGLNAEKNEFDGIANSHVERSETNELLNWIESPVRFNEEGKVENICLLVGNAGMGKTVILKDLYDQLLIKQIPVLGLKADKLYAVSIKELQEKANCVVPLLDLIDQASLNYGQLILIIDQIDALSQSIS
ncbi:MAG: ATP-binding protein, partial [Sphingobacteriales bacterium]